MPQPALGPRWRRLDPDARREQIFHCASALFARRPYAEVSTADIAEAAGVARGLINHYFHTKRELYLQVLAAMVTLPPLPEVNLPRGSLAERAAAGIDWFLDTVERNSTAWITALGAGGLSRDPELELILARGDEVTADRILEAVDLQADLEHRAELRAMIRAFCGLAKAAAREWQSGHELTRAQVHLLLTESLLAVLQRVFPQVRGVNTEHPC
ncbi:MAG: TetR/AcrR family transcriptional regulator [Sciscionella sp.]